MTQESQVTSPSVMATEPSAIIDALFDTDRRVLLIGQPGIGKSTLVNSLAEGLGNAGRACWCIDADPGSPFIGIPGAVSLCRWDDDHWALEGVEALCTLDAGRFRLPLMSAVARITRLLPPSGVILMDGPGVVRGIAGAELIPGIIEAAGIEVALVLVREGRSVPLKNELAALPIETVVVQAASGARRPGKNARARERTRIWDAYLADADEERLPLEQLPIIGTPPPVDAPDAWVGRQIALLDGKHTVAMGEVMALDSGVLHIRLPVAAGSTRTLLVRDAERSADGRLVTSARFMADRLDYLPPPDIAPRAIEGSAGGARVVGRVGMLSVSLVNGVFGDPLLHARLRHERRSLLFDLGEGSRLQARVAHQVSDVFISHTHIDHIAGFLWLLRSRIGEYPVCHLYGPPGLAMNIEGLVRGILWDRVKDRGPCFEISELHGRRLQRYRVQAGHPGCEALGEKLVHDGLLRSEPAFSVRAAILEHVSPVLAYAFEPAQQFNVRKDRLLARGLKPGPWLSELKCNLRAGKHEAVVQLPDGNAESTGALASDLVRIRPGKNLVYATDFSDTEENRRQVIALARGAHTMFCESAFLQQDAEQAARTAHLTTRACGEIAEAAGVARLVPFHFSRRYEHDPGQIYEEIAALTSKVVIPKSMAVFEKPL